MEVRYLPSSYANLFLRSLILACAGLAAFVGLFGWGIGFPNLIDFASQHSTASTVLVATVFICALVGTFCPEARYKYFGDVLAAFAQEYSLPYEPKLKINWAGWVYYGITLAKGWKLAVGAYGLTKVHVLSNPVSLSLLRHEDAQGTYESLGIKHLIESHGGRINNYSSRIDISSDANGPKKNLLFYISRDDLRRLLPRLRSRLGADGDSLSQLGSYQNQERKMP